METGEGRLKSSEVEVARWVIYHDLANLFQYHQGIYTSISKESGAHQQHIQYISYISLPPLKQPVFIQDVTYTHKNRQSDLNIHYSHRNIAYSDRHPRTQPGRFSLTDTHISPSLEERQGQQTSLV